LVNLILYGVGKDYNTLITNQNRNGMDIEIVRSDEHETIKYNERLIQKKFDMISLIEFGQKVETIHVFPAYYIEVLRSDNFLSREFVKIERDKKEPRNFYYTSIYYEWELDKIQSSPSKWIEGNSFTKTERVKPINSYIAAKLLYDYGIFTVPVMEYVKQLSISEEKYKVNSSNFKN